TLRMPNCWAASTTIRYPSGNWVGLIRTAEVRSWAYIIARAHQMISGARGSTTAIWMEKGRIATYCHRLATVASPSVTCSTRVERISTHRSEEHTSELQSRFDLVCRLLLE